MSELKSINVSLTQKTIDSIECVQKHSILVMPIPLLIVQESQKCF